MGLFSFIRRLITGYDPGNPHDPRNPRIDRQRDAESDRDPQTDRDRSSLGGHDSQDSRNPRNSQDYADSRTRIPDRVFNPVQERPQPSSTPATPATSSPGNLDELARRLEMTADQLRAIVPAYRTFTIPKRTGGVRIIDAPVEQFKLFQRRLLKRVLGRLPVHQAATAYERGVSIVHHAMPHVLRQVVVRLDIRDFFPSITADRVRDYFKAIGWRGQALKLLTEWTTHQNKLPQGAPTSPKLANALCYRMDKRITMALAAGRVNMNPKTLEWERKSVGEIAYTRYADDLALSFNLDRHRNVKTAIYLVKRIVEDEGFRLHTRKKLRIMRKGDRQLVTGLVVNAGVNLPRSRRRQLRAVAHHLATGKRATMTPDQLRGWHTLQEMILAQSSNPPQ